MTNDSLHTAVQVLFNEALVRDGREPRTLPQDINKRPLLDRLLCLRQPLPFAPGVLEQIEEILGSEHHENISLNDVPAYSVNDTQSISLYRGDLTLITDDLLLVNPANTKMLGCFVPTHKCLDNIIHSRAGPQVRAECAAILQDRGVDEVDTAVPLLTGAGVLDVRGIVHVAGPALERRRPPTSQERQSLWDTYTNSLNVAAKSGATAVAFPCISTGIFAFPVDDAANIALDAAAAWFSRNSAPMRVIFVLWTDQDEKSYASAVERVFPSLAPVPVFRPLPARALKWIKEAQTVIVHAGAGMSVDAVGKLGLGLDYTSSELFERLYPSLEDDEDLTRLYETIGHEWEDELVKWGFIFSHAHNVLNWGKTPVYANLESVIGDRPYTIMTSNADQLFVQSGFDPNHVFTRQGNYARFQCLKPCSQESYFDAAPWVDRAMPHLDPLDLYVPEELQSDLIPVCPKCGGEVFFNVRGGDWFLEKPYHDAEKRYSADVGRFVEEAKKEGGTVVILEIGAGFNTPSVVRWPSERLVLEHGGVVKLVRVNVDHPEFAQPLPPDSAVGVRVSGGDFLRAVLHE